MQEEVEQRIVSLMISCGKLGEQELQKAIAKLLEQMKAAQQRSKSVSCLQKSAAGRCVS